MLKHNSYHDGKVQSLGYERHGRKQTVGVIAPGEFQFTTDGAERMTVVNGELQARVALQGKDELAMIGSEADRMAERLQAGQVQLRHLVDLVDRSPVVVVEWRNEPGWPMSYVSQSVDQWGYQPGDLLRGDIHYAKLIHPHDIERVTAEAARYFKDGPDEHRQEYRLRCANGRWVWVDDRTTLMLAWSDLVFERKLKQAHDNATARNAH